MLKSRRSGDALGIGSYTLGDAGSLTGLRPATIRRWLGDYPSKAKPTGTSKTGKGEALWTPQYAWTAEVAEIGFRDLIELRFVKAFRDAGLSLQMIRKCLIKAQQIFGEERPFSTDFFRTDGRTLFVEISKQEGEPELIDLSKDQYAFKKVLEPVLKGIEFGSHGGAVRWRPLGKKSPVIVDPEIRFGQPSIEGCGVPTIVLFEAVQAEGCQTRVAALYELQVAQVKAACHFEQNRHTPATQAA